MQGTERRGGEGAGTLVMIGPNGGQISPLVSEDLLHCRCDGDGRRVGHGPGLLLVIAVAAVINGESVGTG